MSTTTNVSSLCDDVLLKIFSYLETDILLSSVFEVCVRWMKLIKHDSLLWVNRWFEWDISQPLISLKYHIRKVPLLKSLKLNLSEGLSYNLSSLEFLMKELASINQVRMLHLNFPITNDILPFLNSHLVSFYASNISKQNYDLFTNLKEICSLKLGNAYDFCGRHLRLIADHCPQLRNFCLAECRSLITLDIEYFINRRKNELEIFEINGYGVRDEAFINLTHCHKLKELRIHNARRMSISTACSIVKMPQLKTIQLYYLESSCFLSLSSCKIQNKIVFFDN